MDTVMLSSFSPEQLSTFLRDAVRQEIKPLIEGLKPNQETEYLSRNQVAELLGITFPTLRDYTLTGKLKGYRIGRRVRYKKAEVEAALTAIR
jgi:excisionase family DNA binding protein